MAGASLLALLDDITTLLDDVAVLSKVAITKTSGVVGDDLALNAEQVIGFKADRELPVVWAVTKGSFLNKLILVPSALLISAFAPRLVVPLLMIGGLYLCYEGFEKIAHKFFAASAEEDDDELLRVERLAGLADPAIDLVALEGVRIKGAIRTDFILSAEIVVIALGTMASAPMSRQIVALTLIAITVTVLVYGLVAGIVKLDDLGLALHRTTGDGARAATRRQLGAAILRAAPYLMRTLSIAGTAAMFLVGGGIIAHGVPFLEHWREALGTIGGALFGAVVGLAAGAITLGVATLTKSLMARARA